MEVVKSQNLKVLKYILIIFLGSILLTISSKIKNSVLSSSNDNANFCCTFFGNVIWI